MDIQVIPALMPESYEELEHGVRIFSETPCIQIDIMDGRFVPTKSWPYSQDSRFKIQDIRLPDEKVFYEVHLMVQEPEEIGVAFINSGAKRIVAHIESFGAADTIQQARQCFGYWRALGAEVGISLLLDTPLSAIAPFIESQDVDVVQVMSIAQIGVQGSTFDVRAYDRIRELRTRYPTLSIAVDGGIKQEHVEKLIDAGATRLCVGSALTRAEYPREAYDAFVACTYAHHDTLKA